MNLAFVRALALIPVLALTASAEDLSGKYRLSGQEDGTSAKIESILVLARLKGTPERYAVKRQHRYLADHVKSAVLSGVATRSGETLQIHYEIGDGLVNVFDPHQPQQLDGRYLVLPDSSLSGWSQALDRAEHKATYQERGARKTAPPPAPPTPQPDPKSAEGLQALQVTTVEVLDTLPIRDAKPPHWRAGAGDAKPSWEPALILEGHPLRLRVTLHGQAELPKPTPFQLVGQTPDGVILRARLLLQQLEGDLNVVAESEQPLSEGVRINELPLSWALRDGADLIDLKQLGRTELRVYTTLAAPRANPIPRPPESRPLVTKLHLDLACGWAEGAGRNVAGDGSICHALDNGLRHLVHPSEQGTHPPAIPRYAPGAPKPENYDQLPAETGGNVINGARMPSTLFYPHDGYKEHYRSNYGWYVLENPHYVGGRCNQQASLVCDVFGTVGIDAKVFYIQRVGRGKKTGRMMLRYYVSNHGKSWNFHGVAQATLADGQPWLYDCSGSGPPDRVNGRPEDLLVLKGDFIDYWKPYWKYSDTKEPVTDPGDWPTEYVGMNAKLEYGQWRGIPLQKGEAPLLPGQTPGQN